MCVRVCVDGRDVLALLQAQFQTEQVPVDAHALGALVKRNGKIKITEKSSALLMTKADVGARGVCADLKR